MATSTRAHGFGKGLWEHRKNLGTFVEAEGAETTNNAAEQALRQAGIWRKLSFGTQSTAGSRFVERLLTVLETCRWQQRNVFACLIEAAVEAHFAGKTALSLLSGVGTFTARAPPIAESIDRHRLCRGRTFSGRADCNPHSAGGRSTGANTSNKGSESKQQVILRRLIGSEVAAQLI